MKNKEIRKSDLPEWEYGDVVIKKFSFGDKLKLSAFTSETIIETVKDTTTGKEVERVKRSAKTIDAYEITMFTIACGLHSIKDSDNYEYVLKGHSNIDEKLEFVKKLDLSFEAGKVILDEIKNFNVDIDDEKKKRLIKVLNGKQTNSYDALIVKRSIMCKLLRCLPSELEKEDFDDIEYIEIVSKSIGKDNPLWLI